MYLPPNHPTVISIWRGSKFMAGYCSDGPSIPSIIFLYITVGQNSQHYATDHLVTKVFKQFNIDTELLTDILVIVGGLWV